MVSNDLESKKEGAPKRGIFENQATNPGPSIERVVVATEVIDQLEKLRTQVHSDMWPKLEKRTRENPHPTDEEIELGAFLEEIEPQVREAVRTLHRKGYDTNSSGFYGDGLQMIDGFLDLTPAETEALLSSGANIKRYQNGFTMVGYAPEEVTLESLKKKWDEIAEALPDRGVPAPIRPTVGTEMFWDKYCDPKDVERVRLIGYLANKWYAPEDKEKMQARLKELQEAKAQRGNG